MGYQLGKNAKLYQGAAGAKATNLINNVKDLTLNLDSAEADVSTRGSDYKLTAPTLKNLSIEFGMIVDPSDANYVAIKNAWLNNTPLAFLCLDKEGGEGPDADFAVTAVPREEALEGVEMINVTIKPTYSSRPPAWESP